MYGDIAILNWERMLIYFILVIEVILLLESD